MIDQPRAIQVTAAVIRQKNLVLITRRPEGARHGGYWEFPGGKQEAGETLTRCLIREIKEELGVDIRVSGHCLSVHHDYGDSSIILHSFYCLFQDHATLPTQGDNLRMTPVKDLMSFDLLPPDREIAQLLNNCLQTGVDD